MAETEIATAQVWRMRAGHNRALAEHMSSPRTRENLLRIADEYELLARQQEEQAAQAARQSGTA